jgi:hypothetical protein
MPHEGDDRVWVVPIAEVRGHVTIGVGDDDDTIMGDAVFDALLQQTVGLLVLVCCGACHPCGRLPFKLKLT